MSAKKIAIIALGVFLLSGCGQKIETKAPKTNAPVTPAPAKTSPDISEVVPPPPPPPPPPLQIQ